MPELTVVLSNLALGGVPRVYLDVLGALAGRGVACRVVAPDGPLRLAYEHAGVAWEPVAWEGPRRDSYQRIAALQRAGGPSILLADPDLAHVLPALAAAGPAILAVHSGAWGLERWFNPEALHRLRRLVRQLVAAGRVRVLTIGERYVDEYAALFALERRAFSILPPAVAARTDVPPLNGGRDRTTVLVVARLSPEKAPQIKAGIALVAERLRQGRPCRLEVIGDGPFAGEAKAMCESALPAGAWQFHGSSHDPMPAMAGAGVVLATGITVLEAASVGAPAVLVRARADELGPLGPVLTEASYATAAAEGFGARYLPPVAPDDVWRDLDALDAADLAAVRARVLRENSVDAAATALAAMVDGWAVPRDGALAALGELAADLDGRLRDTQRLADELWAVKVQLEQRLDVG